MKPKLLIFLFLALVGLKNIGRYLMQHGYIKTDAHGIRGEMPGQKTNAIKNNNKGPF